MIDLLAGTSETDNSDAHNQLVEDMIRIFEAQRLISLATIFELVDHLEGVAKGEKANMALINKTASPHLRDPASAQHLELGGTKYSKFRLLVGKAHRGAEKAEPPRSHRACRHRSQETG